MARSSLFLFALLALLWPSSAFAYLDPGTGSYIIQVIVAGVAASAFAIKMTWVRIKNFFSGSKKEDQHDE